MQNVVKQTIYSLQKSRLFIKCCSVIFLVTFASAVSGLIASDSINAEIFSGNIDTITMFGTIVVIVFAALGIGVNFKCKTIYRLIMGGTPRKTVFLGSIAALFPYIAFMAIIQLAVLYFTFAIFGSSDLFNDLFPYAVCKIIVFIVIYYSYAVLSVAFTFISKSTIGGIGGSIIVMVIYNAIGLASDYFPEIFGHDVSGYCGMFVYRTALTDDLTSPYLAFVAVLHIVFSLIYSFIGCKLFKKADLI